MQVIYELVISVANATVERRRTGQERECDPGRGQLVRDLVLAPAMEVSDLANSNE